MITFHKHSKNVLKKVVFAVKHKTNVLLVKMDFI